MEFISEYVVPYWPFFAFTLFIAVLAQILKTRLLTVVAARSNRVVYWIRRVLPLILIGVGALTGLVWGGEPSPGVSSTASKVLYFIGAACLAITMFSAFKNWMKKKYDVDILPDTVPPEG